MTGRRSWDDLFADARFHWTEPDPAVVAAAGRWWERGVRLIHDLGCGAGRHMAFLQASRFEVIGSDVAQRGLEACASQLREAGLRAALVRADMSAHPFADAAFDAAIAINVLNHGTRADVQRAIDEVHRTLRPGGEVLLTALNTWDWRYGSGAQVETASFVLADGPEAGILHHFFDEADLRAWLAGFEIIDLQRVRGELTLSTAPDGGPVFRDAWQVLARR